jgi:hypothetical protein
MRLQFKSPWITGNGHARNLPFYGIIIRMYLIDREHPPRHIHIKYGEHVAVMSLDDLSLIEGTIPKRCLQLVSEWAALNQAALIRMWDTQNFHSIAPLE